MDLTDTDPRLRKMADVLINYSIAVAPSDWTVIHTPLLGMPLAVACVEATLQAGGNPSVNVVPEEVQEALLRVASDDQLAFISPVTEAIVRHEICEIGIRAPTNTRTMSGIDPRRLALRNRAGASVQTLYNDRVARGELRWTATAYPTQAAAQDAGMSLREYREFVFGAGLLHEPDPVAAWKRLGERQQRLVEALDGKDEIHITAPGTDLTLSVAGRTWLNDDGHKNFPGGEVFTSPVEDSADGFVQFNYPAAYGGREVSGVRLAFRQGRVVEAQATTDDAYLREMIASDDGSGRLGEVAFGTNPGIQRFTRNILFDEKIGGTLHLALGQAIADAGGSNTSALHWDMVLDLRADAEVTMDGVPIVKNGELLV
jgi:aminopeptidase